jgi:hypothetical protein
MVHISEGMCRQCAWERIKNKCKMCGEVIEKVYPRLLAHITSHYTSNELLYKEGIEMTIILINFEGVKTLLNEECYAIKCKICGDTFMLKKEETIISRWIDHVKSHYIDKDLFKKDRIAKEIVHLNYDSVLELFPTSHNEEEESNNNTNVSGGSMAVMRTLMLYTV